MMNKLGNIVWLVMFPITLMAQNNNVNQNTIILNNQPVVERVVEKEHVVYVTPSPPKRKAHSIPSPVCLLGEIWVYTEDLGKFKSTSQAKEILQHLNSTKAYDRNDWRIPTQAEMSVMKKNYHIVGLGEGTYLTMSNNEGFLRPVSTGITISQQNANAANSHKAQEQELAYQRQQQKIREQALKTHIDAGLIDKVGEIYWSKYNVGTEQPIAKGSLFSTGGYSCPSGWRLPSKEEFSAFLNQATKYRRTSSEGFLVTFYQCGNVQLPSGLYMTDSGTYRVGDANMPEGKCIVRLVYDY